MPKKKQKKKKFHGLDLFSVVSSLINEIFNLKLNNWDGNYSSWTLKNVLATINYLKCVNIAPLSFILVTSQNFSQLCISPQLPVVARSHLQTHLLYIHTIIIEPAFTLLLSIMCVDVNINCLST